MGDVIWNLLPICIIVLINWFGAITQRMRLYYATKPLVMIGLILFFLLSTKSISLNVAFLFGLLFSLLGDIFLIFRSPNWFFLGLIAFLIAHLAYFIGFNQVSAPLLISALFYGLGLGVYVALAKIVIHRTQGKPELKTTQKLFLVYGFFLVMMTCSAILCFYRPGWSRPAAVLAGLGGISFLISDVLLALNKLGKRIPLVGFLVISTYHLSQFAIVAAVLLNRR